MTTLEKVRLFERYLELTQRNTDRGLDLVLDKVLERKRQELTRHRDKMRQELTAFEKRYGMTSGVFYERFQKGELGDAMDYFDWSATWQMYHNISLRIRASSSEQKNKE